MYFRKAHKDPDLKVCYLWL